MKNRYIQTGGLSAEQVADVVLLILDLVPGVYTLREIFGEVLWGEIKRKQAWGHWFKNSVSAGMVPGVRLAGRKSNKSRLYEVQPKTEGIVGNTSKLREPMARRPRPSDQCPNAPMGD